MNVGTQQRNRVAMMAKTKPHEALKLARSIDDPWVQCQALSVAAVLAPDQRSRKGAIADAFLATNEPGEPNRIVTASSCGVPNPVVARFRPAGDGSFICADRPVGELQCQRKSIPRQITRESGKQNMPIGRWFRAGISPTSERHPVSSPSIV